MKQLGGDAGGGAARRLARALDGPRKRDLPSQIGRIVAEALGSLAPPARPSLRHKQATKAAASCRRAKMAATLRLARNNADNMREYLLERDKKQMKVMQIVNTQSASEGDSSAPLCVICLDMLDNKREQGTDGVTLTVQEALPCGHVFHRACVSQWLQYRRFCPIDRLSVDVEEEATAEPSG